MPPDTMPTSDRTPHSGSQAGRLGLRSGDWVVVRSKNEILATLDENGELDRLPFQPEMLAFCGRRMRVFRTAHKTCDTINKTGERRMRDAVHLENAYCDGSGHGGCQAGCLMFWKEAWLERAPAGERQPPGSSLDAVAAENKGCSEATLVQRTASTVGGETVWRCQTTALYEATEPLPWWSPGQYIKDVTGGNHTVGSILGIMCLAVYRKLVHLGVGYRALISLYNGWQALRGGRPYPLDSGRIPAGQSTPHEDLNLQPGDEVEVKSQDEILATITTAGMNRGMRFDKEMSLFCGGRFKVERRVERLINEQTGRMTAVKTPCITLEGVYCKAVCSDKRLGCPRALPSYWREIWLRKL